MSQKIPSYIRKQLPIPGLEIPKRNETGVRKPTLQEQINTLQDRILTLELELSLLQILLERGAR